MEIIGDQLILKRITMNDLDFVCRIECDRQLWFFEEYIESDEQVVREKYLQEINKTTETNRYDFIIRLATDKRNTPLGLAQIWSYSKYRKSWEIGFALLPEYWGHGYGSEAARLLLKFAFEKLHAHKVVGMCNSNNTHSATLMKHIGMTKDAIFREELYWNNQWTDQYFFSILEKEFFTNEYARSTELT